MKLNWATRITLLRIILIIPFVSFMLKINDPDVSLTLRHLARYAAALIFLIMAASDGVDGYLARRKGQITALGTFLDPLADKLLMTCTCLLLASKQGSVDGFKLPTTVVVLIISKDLLLLLGFIIVYFVTSQIKIVPVMVGKTATFLQLAMVGGILLAPEISHIIPFWIWFLRALWWSAAGLAIWAGLIYIRTGSRYIEEFEQNRNMKNQ